jgi:hypothetical protein
MTASRLIRVDFLDADTGQCFTWTEMPAEQLPMSFESRTTLNMEGQDWEVVTAEPMTRAEYEATGKLRITLRKITLARIPSGELLFSLPTICDEIPSIAPGTSKLGKRVLELHEDDWRQIELVISDQQEEIDACLNHIRRIFAEERTPNGFFRTLHVRKEAARPLQGCRLSLPELNRYFSALMPLDGLAYRDVAGLIEGGFACESASGLQLYGAEHEGWISALGLVIDHVQTELEEDGQSLAALMRDHQLCLIDWCRLRQIGSSAMEREIMEYLNLGRSP